MLPVYRYDGVAKHELAYLKPLRIRRVASGPSPSPSPSPSLGQVFCERQRRKYADDDAAPTDERCSLFRLLLRSSLANIQGVMKLLIGYLWYEITNLCSAGIGSIHLRVQLLVAVCLCVHMQGGHSLLAMASPMIVREDIGHDQGRAAMHRFYSCTILCILV